MIRRCLYKIVILVVTIYLCCNVIIFAQTSQASLEDKGFSEEEFIETITYYYLNPQPEKLISALKFVLDRKELIYDINSFGKFAHHIATVANRNATFLNTLKNLKEKYTGIQAKLIQQIIAEAENFQSPLPDSEEHIDYLWAEFMATGDRNPIIKIIEVLGYPNDTEKNRLLIGLAEWSLNFQVQKHPSVYEIIKSESTHAEDIIKRKLEDILQKYRQRGITSKKDKTTGTLNNSKHSEELADKSKLEYLFDELNRVANENSSYKIKVNDDIEHIATEKDIPFLIKIVEDKNNKNSTKNIAIRLLAKFRAKQAVPVLIEALNNKEVRINAAYAFCEIIDHRCIDKLLEVLEEPVDLFNKYPLNSSPFKDYEALYRSLRGNMEQALITNATTTLILDLDPELKLKVISKLIKMLASPYFDVRVSAIKVLSTIAQELSTITQEDAIISELIKMLDDRNVYVVFQTLNALLKLKKQGYINKDIKPILDRLLKTTDDHRLIQVIKDIKIYF